ncbi:MAG: protein translocase subunit SecF [Rhizobacter sp.]|nr:protein translocase subunit SecF [Chlorobiales bacterium]
MRIFENTNFNFMGVRKNAYIFSVVILLIGLVSIAVRGFNYGIDFKGGTEIVVRFAKDVPIDEVRSSLTGAGVGGQVKNYGSDREVMITSDFRGDLNDLSDKLKTSLDKTFPQNPHEIMRIDSVGPSIASDLQASAIYALLGALAMILVYVGFRFEFKFAAAGVIAIFHDVLTVLGLFSLLGGVFTFMPLEVDQTTIAAFLTIIGYSITDTVVVYDRIRENLKLRRSEPYEKIFNDSINETMSRTIITSTTVMLTVIILIIFAGPTVRGFAFAMLMGILIGTYSSIFVAAPIIVDWQLRAGGKLKVRG